MTELVKCFLIIEIYIIEDEVLIFNKYNMLIVSVTTSIQGQQINLSEIV